MTILASETRNIQNPAFCATVLWRFTCGYAEAHETKDPPPLPLLFLVLPIILHSETRVFVKSTIKASGLRAFAAKFGDSKNAKQDLLLAIHDRALRLRNLSAESLRTGLATSLMSITREATVVPLSTTPVIAGLSTNVRQIFKDAEKLGAWCAALTLHEIAATLKTAF
jgi:Family of unknown function (DUF6521)